MAVYHGGQEVKGGFYLKCSTWEFEAVTRGGGILHGDRGTRYIRVSLPAVMVAGPLVGLAYVISLPLVFCSILGCFLARQVGQALKIVRW